MKMSYHKAIAIFLSLSVFMLSSCIKSDECEECNNILITTQSIDSDSDNIKNNIRLYFFTQDKKLEKIVSTTLNAEIKQERDKEYTIIAVGYSQNARQPDIKIGTSITDADITLSTTAFANIQVSESSEDIFYGRLTITKDCESEKEIIWLKRKVAALTIITQNLQTGLHTTDTDFNYIVRETYGTMDFAGNFTGAKIAYKPDVYFNPTKKFIAPMFYTFPLTQADQLYIDIYKGTTLVKTYTIDKKDEPNLLQSDKHTIVIISFSDGEGGGSAMDVTCTVKDWLGADLDETFD